MPRVLGDLTRRRVLLGAGAALCTACASWPQVRDGSTPSRRSVVFMAREFASISGLATFRRARRVSERVVELGVERPSISAEARE